MGASCRVVAAVVLLGAILVAGGCSNGTSLVASAATYGSASTSGSITAPTSPPRAGAASSSAAPSDDVMSVEETCGWLAYLLNWSRAIGSARSVTVLQDALYTVERSINDGPVPAPSAARLIVVLRRYAQAAHVLNAAAQPTATLREFQAKIASTARLRAAVRTLTSSVRALATWHLRMC